MHLSATTYFTSVGIITTALLAAAVANSAALTHSLGVALGWREPLVASEASFFNARVAPVFDAYCVACHGPAKAKGGLRLDSFRNVRLTGKNGPVVVPGDSAGSLVLQRMQLPGANIRAMPPQGRDRFTNDDLATLTLWIDAGASGAMPPSDFPDAPPEVEEVEFEPIDFEAVKEARAALADAVSGLQRTFPYTLTYESRGSAALTMNTYAVGPDFDDDSLARFAPVTSALVELDLSTSAITDNAAAVIAQMTGLRVARLPGAAVAERMVSALEGLPALEVVMIVGEAQDRAALAALTDDDIQLYAPEAAE